MGESKWGGSHAVVIGGSMTGLAAAGVPQAVHAHTLLIRGQQILEGIFPGLTADLLAAGAVISDTVRDAAWYQHGTFKLQTESGLPAITMSRALLEWSTRAPQTLVTLQAMLGDAPSTDDVGFLEFARSLPVPDLYETLKAGEPLGSAVAHRAPSTVRRHYERMARFPEGFLVVGDAVCSLNPRYGQGMTAAALGAETLAQCLQTQTAADGFSLRFQQALAQAVLAFYQVVHLLKPVSILLRPALVWKVLTQ
ncbi:MAG TPA: hypothetical protein VK464_27935 [Symbiobacteriaceae bacterium]|nr:hypothetical protein [Symbiobacteriaceae bacterium]